jgi:hypothetical protein
VLSLALVGTPRPVAQAEQRPDPAPLVVDMAGDGYSLTSVADGVMFDLDGDGVLEQVAWTTAESDEAFLAVDENHNGRIDGGQELVGAWRSGPSNGFAALGASAAYDQGNAYSPGTITASDPIFKRLILWVDVNHKGVSEENEMMSVSHAGFTKIFLGYTAVGAPDRSGNMFVWQAEALKTSERGVEVARNVTAIAFARGQ